MSIGPGGVSFNIPFFTNADTMFAFAERQAGGAEGWSLTLNREAGNLVPPVISPVFPVGTIPPAISVDPVPSTQPIIWTAPGIPTPFVGTLDVSALFPAPFDETPPTVTFGTTPTPPTDAAPTSPTIDLNFVYPTLNLTLPTAPSLLSLQTFAFNAPTFPTPPDSNVPVLTAVSPSIREYTPGALYTSALLTDLRATLDARITSGTNTGLPVLVETQIWDSAREREYRQQYDALLALDRDMETLGYAFPPGAFVDARGRIYTETTYNIQTLSRDVSIAQAKLVQENIAKSLETAVAIEGKSMDYSNEVEQRIFEATKYATEAGIEIYNAQVRAYVAFLDAYRLKINIYEAQIRGAIATVEFYKTELEAERIKADVNTALVAQYKVQVDAALAAVEVYKASIDAIRTKAEIEKIKVEAFGEQVRAYTAKINAYTAQVEGFRASIQAEQAKVEVYKAQVDAFAQIVNAATKEAEAKIEEFKGLIAAKQEQYEGYKALILGMSEQVKAIAASNQVVAELYRATVAGKSAYNETLTKQWQVALDEAERVTEIGVKAAEANAQLFMTARSLAMDAAKVGAQVHAQLGAAALGAINWSTHLAYNANESAAYSTDIRQSQDLSVSTNYNYNASI